MTYEEVFKGLNYLEQQMKKKDQMILRLREKYRGVKMKNKILEKRFMALPLPEDMLPNVSGKKRSNLAY